MHSYGTTGIRISSEQQIDSDGDQTWDSHTRTEFLVDHRNFTDYQQVVRETHFDATTGNVTKTVDYTIGHDEISQTTKEYDAQGNVTSETTLFFAHDGHGSTRVLTDLAAAVVQMFVHDAAN